MLMNIQSEFNYLYTLITNKHAYYKMNEPKCNIKPPFFCDTTTQIGPRSPHLQVSKSHAIRHTHTHTHTHT